MRSRRVPPGHLPGILLAVAFASLLQRRSRPRWRTPRGWDPWSRTGTAPRVRRPTRGRTRAPPCRRRRSRLRARCSSESTRGDDRGSNAVCDVGDVSKSRPPFSETSTGSARSTALRRERGRLAPEHRARTSGRRRLTAPPRRHRRWRRRRRARGERADPTLATGGRRRSEALHRSWRPPRRRVSRRRAPSCGNSVSAIGCAWNSNVAPKTVKLPSLPTPAHLHRDEAGGVRRRRQADDAVTLPRRRRHRRRRSNLHRRKRGLFFSFAIPGALMESSGTSDRRRRRRAGALRTARGECAPRAPASSVPPLAGPRVGSNPKTLARRRRRTASLPSLRARRRRRRAVGRRPRGGCHAGATPVRRPSRGIAARSRRPLTSPPPARWKTRASTPSPARAPGLSPTRRGSRRRREAVTATLPNLHFRYAPVSRKLVPVSATVRGRARLLRAERARAEHRRRGARLDGGAAGDERDSGGRGGSGVDARSSGTRAPGAWSPKTSTRRYAEETTYAADPRRASGVRRARASACARSPRRRRPARTRRPRARARATASRGLASHARRFVTLELRGAIRWLASRRRRRWTRRRAGAARELAGTPAPRRGPRAAPARTPRRARARGVAKNDARHRRRSAARRAKRSAVQIARRRSRRRARTPAPSVASSKRGARNRAPRAGGAGATTLEREPGGVRAWFELPATAVAPARRSPRGAAPAPLRRLRPLPRRQRVGARDAPAFRRPSSSSAIARRRKRAGERAPRAPPRGHRHRRHVADRRRRRRHERRRRARARADAERVLAGERDARRVRARRMDVGVSQVFVRHSAEARARAAAAPGNRARRARRRRSRWTPARNLQRAAVLVAAQVRSRRRKPWRMRAAGVRRRRRERARARKAPTYSAKSASGGVRAPARLLVAVPLVRRRGRSAAGAPNGSDAPEALGVCFFRSGARAARGGGAPPTAPPDFGGGDRLQRPVRGRRSRRAARPADRRRRRRRLDAAAPNVANAGRAAVTVDHRIVRRCVGGCIRREYRIVRRREPVRRFSDAPGGAAAPSRLATRRQRRRRASPRRRRPPASPPAAPCPPPGRPRRSGTTRGCVTRSVTRSVTRL